MVEGSRESASLLQCGYGIRESHQRVCGSPTACEMEAMRVLDGLDWCPVFKDRTGRAVVALSRRTPILTEV